MLPFAVYLEVGTATFEASINHITSAMDSNAKMTESRQQSEKPGNHEEYHELEESHGYAASASSSSSSESDTDPRDYTYEGRIKHAQERMGDRTAFFYGKSPSTHLSFHLSLFSHQSQSNTLTPTGTLMAKEVLYRVIFGTSNPSKHAPITITTTPALLPNHLRTRVLHADYPAVTPSPGHSVLGTYVTGLTNADIYRLDLFEGPQYTLRDVKIRLLKKEGDAKGHGNVEGKEVETQTYIWIAGDDLLEHAEWDIETFRREKLRRWVGDSDEFQGISFFFSFSVSFCLLER